MGYIFTLTSMLPGIVSCEVDGAVVVSGSTIAWLSQAMPINATRHKSSRLWLLMTDQHNKNKHKNIMV